MKLFQSHTSFAVSAASGPTVADVCAGGQMVLFLRILNLFLCSQSDIRDRPTKSIPHAAPEYDFIVVGSGSAGSVVASRLSANPRHRVLLLEAGGQQPIDLQVPGLFYPYVRSSVDWGFYNEPNGRAFLSLPNQRSVWPRGKMIGGCSSLNAMIYLRGNPSDYDTWQQLDNDGWSYEDVLPYFRRTEKFVGADREEEDGYHGRDGPMTVSEPAYVTPLQNDAFKAATEMGWAITDLNARNCTGCMLPQSVIRNGVRDSAAKAFLRPNDRRRNLHIMLHAQVTKILLEKRTNRAIGVRAVRLDRGNEVFDVRARKEVILCAGNDQSPKLLMLSGIGKPAELRRWNIKPLVNSPGVGQNLQNHPAVLMTVESNRHSRSRLDWSTASEYMRHRTGPLATLGILAHIKFPSAYATDVQKPDIQITLLDDFLNIDEICGYATSTDASDKMLLTAVVTLQKPKARGHIALRSGDPLDAPMIFSNELGSDEDITRLVDGTRQAIELFEADAFRSYNFTGVRVQSGRKDGPCGRFEWRSPEYWRCVTVYDTIHLMHPVGTCRMGPGSDRWSVVDNELRVHAVPGLRVVDASVMPTIVAANTHATVMMIGEKAAESIARTWQ